MKRQKGKIGVLILVLLLISMVFAAGTTTAGGEKNLNAKIYTESGTTEAYGGGDYFLIAFGTNKTGLDAAFGVIWGTEDNPNSIIPFVIQARYLGVAQVYDDEGNVIEHNFPLKLYTFYGLKLETMLEFNDENGDGICNFAKNPDAAWWESKWEHETIYNKRIDMKTAWTASNVTSSTDEDAKEKTWEFSLTAENQEYKKLKLFWPLDEGAEENVLEELKFTFHLRARLVEVDNVSVPQFNVTITDDLGLWDEAVAWPVLSSERMEDKIYSGKKAVYGIKWDHEINGWDFNPNNENKSLLLEFSAILGNFIPATTTHWFKAEFLKYLGEDGKAQFTNQNGNIENSTAGDPEDLGPRRLKTNRIDFEGNWSKVGRFTWVSNVTVDGEEKEMYAQVQAGIPFFIPGRFGRIYTGFALIGGLSYPGGDSIYHDPGMEGEMTFDISEVTDHEPLIRPFLFVLLGLVIATIIGVVAYSKSKGKKRRPQGYENSYDRFPSTYPQQDWSQYYDRKR